MDALIATYSEMTKVKVTSINDDPLNLAKAPVKIVILIRVWSKLDIVACLPS